MINADEPSLIVIHDCDHHPPHTFPLPASLETQSKGKKLAHVNNDTTKVPRVPPLMTGMWASANPSHLPPSLLPAPFRVCPLAHTRSLLRAPPLTIGMWAGTHAPRLPPSYPRQHCILLLISLSLLALSHMPSQSLALTLALANSPTQPTPADAHLLPLSGMRVSRRRQM
ncbi:unnamed protein product [Cyclocybe aegerita]|uniref:Uncharacterized protein n=1 Tax=Cyclocybe aegerita TaxID=1973307 RepID=A0A8S0XTM1_CYCAE|nr:unnamed protein product [Cyclocybe aegerita]